MKPRRDSFEEEAKRFELANTFVELSTVDEVASALMQGYLIKAITPMNCNVGHKLVP